MAGLGQPQPAAPTVAVAPSKSQINHVLNTVSGFAAAEQQAIQRRDQDVLKAAAVVVDPLAERTQAALTRFGMPKGKYAEHVGEMAGVNWPAVLRRVPRVRTPMTTPADANGIAGSYRRPVYEDNHDTINFLARTARDLAGAFTSDFPDLNRALLNLKNIASSPLQYIDANGAESTEYRQAVRHVEHYLKRAEEQVVTTAKMVENFLRLEAKVAADLAQAGPLDVEPPAREERLNMHFPPLVERSASSYVDFEPREVMRDAPPPNDAPPATKVGNDGIRVGNAALPEWGRGGKEARTL